MPRNQSSTRVRKPTQKVPEVSSSYLLGFEDGKHLRNGDYFAGYKAGLESRPEFPRGYNDGLCRKACNPRTSEYLEGYRSGRETSRIGESRLGRGKG